MDRDEVRRIAALARLEVPAERMARMAADLTEILDFVATLRGLDLEGIEPTVFAPAGAALRDDRIDEARRLGAERALAAAPEADGGFFLVPPIVENVNP